MQFEIHQHIKNYVVGCLCDTLADYYSIKCSDFMLCFVYNKHWSYTWKMIFSILWRVWSIHTCDLYVYWHECKWVRPGPSESVRRPEHGRVCNAPCCIYPGWTLTSPRQTSPDAAAPPPARLEPTPDWPAGYRRQQTAERGRVRGH